MKIENFKINYDKKTILQQILAKQKKWMWIVLFGCLLLQMFPYCVSINLSSVFAGSDWLAWTKGNTVLIGLTFTMGSLASAIAGPFIAKLFKIKINMKFVYASGVCLAILGFCIQSINSFAKINNVPAATTVLWISNIVSQVGVMIFSGLGINNLISKWWPTNKRGFALGLAFTGGSIGNIWMRQLIGKLANEFNNVLPNNNFENYVYGEQYATYLIVGAMGLIGGILIVLFICRKPLPPVEIFGFDANNQTKADIKCVNCGKEFGTQINNLQSQNISPLELKKYPLYYILAFGFLIMQMGVIHSSMNGIIIANSLCINHPNWNYNDILAIGGTVFGISCLTGNFCGGILNDKLGPQRSIALAGICQCSSIIFLLFSIQTPQMVFAYYVLAGISVYAYTSSPAYIAGRLFGTQYSNEHTAVFGIFRAAGFAIANSISGLLTGPTTSNNIHFVFNSSTQGNILSILIFVIICLFFGSSMISICIYLISKKGINGLREYSPSKYSWIIFLKHRLKIKIDAFKYNHKKNSQSIININNLRRRNFEIKKFVNNNFTQLSQSQKNILNEMIKNNNLYVKQKCNKHLQGLIDRGIIECHKSIYYSLTFSTIKGLVGNLNNCWFFANKQYQIILKKYNSIYKHKNEILNKKYAKKSQKINHQIKLLKKKSIDGLKEGKHNLTVENKLNRWLKKYNNYYEQFKDKKNVNDFTIFYREYCMLVKINELNDGYNKYSKKILKKQEALNKKLVTISYILNYNLQKNNEAANLLIQYYINQDFHNELLVQQEVNAIKSYKINNLKNKVEKIQNKYNKLFKNELYM